MVINVPPAAPIASLRSPFLSKTIVGHEDESGLFPGDTEFAGHGANPNELMMSGEAKSSISLFKMMPVLTEASSEPNLT